MVVEMVVELVVEVVILFHVLGGFTLFYGLEQIR